MLDDLVEDREEADEDLLLAIGLYDPDQFLLHALSSVYTQATWASQ